MHRLFVALRPPGPIRDRLLDLMDDGDGLRWQGEEQLHLTLRFVGEVDGDIAEDLALALGTLRFEPFALRLAGAGCFEARRGGTLWAGVDPREPLAALAGKVDRACVAAGLPPERRAFHPHITLARWKGGAAPAGSFLQRHTGLTSEPWTVDRFILYESRLGHAGAHYEAVATYPARAAAVPT